LIALSAPLRYNQRQWRPHGNIHAFIIAVIYSRGTSVRNICLYHIIILVFIFLCLYTYIYTLYIYEGMYRTYRYIYNIIPVCSQLVNAHPYELVYIYIYLYLCTMHYIHVIACIYSYWCTLLFHSRTLYTRTTHDPL